MEQGFNNDYIERCRLGEPEAWAVLYKHYWGILLRFIYCFDPTITVEDAKEITQEVFIRAIANIQTFRGQCPIQNWLYRIATNLTLDWLERKKAQKRGSGKPDLSLDSVIVEDDGQLSLPLTKDPSLQAQQKEYTSLLLQALKTLPPACQRIIRLHYFEGLTYEQIGRILELNPKTVSSRLSRCIKQLKKQFDDILERSSQKENSS